MFLASFQALILLLLGVGVLLMTGFCLVDAATRPAAAFRYADKRTKTFWVVVMAIATAVSAAVLGSLYSLGIVGLLGAAAGGFYLVDVRPAVRQYRAR